MDSSTIASALYRTTLAGLLALCTALSGCLDQQTDALERALNQKVGQPFKADSPYAGVMHECLIIDNPRDSCRIGKLPPLGHPDGEAPGIEEIMDRVMVSHRWMGENFRAVLEAMPAETLRFFGSTTAIVIHRDIRPSYYSSWRAAIFIDPNYLWLTPEQRSTINLTPDFRSNYGEELGFDIPWRHVKDNAPAYQAIPVSRTSVESRQLEDILLHMAHLLFHELAHAMDFLEPRRVNSLDEGERIAHATRSYRLPNDPFMWGSIMSDYFSLDSTPMRELADVRYRGATPTATQLSYGPDAVADFFSPDRATDWYSYSTSREHLAMLFEHIALYRYFGVESDVAVTTALPGGGNGNDLEVAWGQRNRFADPQLEYLVTFLARYMFQVDEDDLPAFLSSLPEPVQLQEGESWHDNLNPQTLIPPVSATKEQAISDTRRERH
jgi:hypothetical protein